MSRPNRLPRKVTCAAALIFPLVLGLAGCNGGYYRPIAGNPPPGTVTFPAASTQGWLQQYGTGYVILSTSGNRTLGGDIAYGVTTDPQGNVIVLDQTSGAFPGFTTNHFPEFAVVKFDGSGNRLWTQQFGTGAGEFPYAIATDSQGNIIVGGLTDGAFPGLTNSGGASESVVIKLAPSGQITWVQQFPSAGSSQVNSLATDAQGNVIAGGSTTDLQNNSHGYIMKLNAATGAVIWNQGSGTAGFNSNVSGVSVDSQGNVIAVGNFAGSGSTASTTYMATKLNGTNGQTLWLQLPVSVSSDNIQNLIYTQVALDPQGDVFVVGINDSAGYSQCAIARLANDSGNQQWQQQFGAAQSCVPGNVATDAAGNVLMTGNTLHPFFPDSNPSKLDDVFLAKITPIGAGVWLQQFGTGNEGGGTTISAPMYVATDSQSHAYVAGTTSGAFPGFTNPNFANELFLTQFAP